MSKFIFVLTAVFLLGVSSYAASKERVFFVSPKNGATVAKTFKVKFGEENLNVEPAGKDVDNKKDGHFHILVDQDSYPENEVIPSDATHLHYGKGQRETTLTLTPGTHKLTLQFADGAHRSDGKPLSETITVNVK